MNIIHRYDAAHRTLNALTKRGTFQLYQMQMQLESYCRRWHYFPTSRKYQRADALAAVCYWELERRNHAKHFGHFERRKLDEAKRVFVKLSLMDAHDRAAH